MRFATYADPHGRRRAGVVKNGSIVDAAAAAREAGLDGGRPLQISVKDMLSDSALCSPVEEGADAISARGGGMSLEEVRLTAPIPDPEKIICVGLNYLAHTRELESEIPTKPALFAKFAPSLVGSGANIRLPTVSSQVDWEGELAVVIGRRCHRISVEEAPDALAGCMPFNDVSARDLQMETSQWLAGKALDTFAPCGPALVTMDEVPDIQDIRLTTRVNGETVQQCSTADMIFSVAEIVSFISQLMTLSPGDIIATGTPEGVGFRQDPPRFLAPGDVVEVELENVGLLVNQVEAAEVGRSIAGDAGVALA